MRCLCKVCMRTKRAYYWSWVQRAIEQPLWFCSLCSMVPPKGECHLKAEPLLRFLSLCPPGFSVLTEYSGNMWQHVATQNMNCHRDLSEGSDLVRHGETRMAHIHRFESQKDLALEALCFSPAPRVLKSDSTHLGVCASHIFALKSLVISNGIGYLLHRSG